MARFTAMSEATLIYDGKPPLPHPFLPPSLATLPEDEPRGSVRPSVRRSAVLDAFDADDATVAHAAVAATRTPGLEQRSCGRAGRRPIEATAAAGRDRA